MIKLLKQLAAFAFAVIEILLVFRFILKLLAASSGSTFVALIYANTAPLIKPFLFAFPTPSVRGGFVLEFTTLFAIFAYAFLGYILQEILEVIKGK